MSADKARKPLNIELPAEIRAFLDDRKAALGSSYKKTIELALRHFQSAIAAAEAGQPTAEPVAALTSVMCTAALATAKAKPKPQPKPKAKAHAQAQA